MSVRLPRLLRALLWLTLVLLGMVSADVRAEPALPEDFVAPVLLEGAEVQYPPELLEQADPPAGQVRVKLTVGVDGVPQDLQLEQGLHPKLDALALEAVGRLRYQPGTLKGEPVPVTLRIGIDFVPPGTETETETETGTDTDTDTGTDTDTDTGTDTGTGTGTGPDAVRIRGQLLEAGHRTPITAARILAVPAPEGVEVGEIDKKRYADEPPPAWQVQAISDAEGDFELPAVPAGKLRIVVLAPGYERFEFVEGVVPRQELEVRYYLQRLPDNPYRTVVQAPQRREEVVRRTITTEEIRNLPGTQGDALKAIQNFPGVARAPFGAGLLVIRGADPTDSAVFLGEHEIPQLFHFGGLTSVFNADVITQIDYLPGNFGARYGDATGGVIDVRTRPGRRDGYHGYIDSDLFDTGILAEGPVGKGSFILSGRRSYIDLLLPALLPDDAGLQATVAPRYYDYQALLDYPVSRGNLSVKIFGSDDRTKIVAADPNDVEVGQREQFETTLFFHRFDLLYENHRDGWDFLVTPSYRYDTFSAAASDLFRFTVNTHTFSGRAEMGRQLSRRIRFDVGTQLYAGTFSIDAESPPFPGDEAGFPDVILQTRTQDVFALPAIFGSVSVGVTERFTLIPEARVTYYAVLFERATFDPRLRFAWRLAERSTLRGAVGLFSQVPDVTEWNRTFGNPRVGPEQALHTSLSFTQEFDYAISLEVGAFYKELRDLATGSEEVVLRDSGQIGPENFASHGRGRIYGAEVFLRKELTAKVFGWVSYTLSRSLRRPRPDEAFAVFDLDQTHILTVIGVYRLPKNWQVGARFRLASGNPYTPVVGAAYDAGNADYIGIDGPRNSQRVPLFHQLDLRVDKRFVWRRVILTTYLDIQNVYNRQNAEFIDYGYDFRQRQFIPSLPIIPSLGLKLEF